MSTSLQAAPEPNFQTRLVAPAARGERGNVTGVEIGDVVARLLLFETYILDSVRLREIPHLLSAFSADGLRELISSRALQIRCEPLMVAQIGQSRYGADKDRPVLPSGSYRFSVVRIAEFNKFIHRCMEPFHQIAGLPHKSIVRLKSTVASNLVRLPEGVQNLIQQEINQELRRSPALFRVAVDMEVKRRFGSDSLEIPISARLEEISNGDFRFETDLSSKLNISHEDVHVLGQAAGFGIGCLTQRLSEMRIHSALTGFSEVDTALAESKFGYVANAIAPRSQERRFERVVQLSGFPDIRLEWGERVINVDKLLKVRESDECRVFRDWLRSSDEVSDGDLQAMISNLRAKLGLRATSTSGKVIRFMASTGAGLLGALPGAIAGVIDSFIVEKLFPTKGISTFINDQYPSIFEYPGDRNGPGLGIENL